MPLITAAQVFASARTYLNDPSATIWTDALLLPYLQEAYEYGRNEQALKQLPNAYKTDVRTITAGSVTYTPLPSDLLIPIKVEERTPGSIDPYDPMTQTVWDPNETQVDTLRSWNWRNQAINFLGATANREVRIYYMGDMDPTGLLVGSTNLLGNIRVFLGAKVAALVQAFALQNITQARIADDVAEQQLKKILQVQSNARQAVPIRMKPHISYPRYWGQFRRN